MSLLLLLGGVGNTSVTPISTGDVLAILAPDEVPTGTPTRIWCEYVHNTGTTALDSEPQIRIFSLADDGTRANSSALTYMVSAGEAYYYDWTPSAAGPYLVTVAGLASAVSVFSTAQVTARPKFDPVAFALSDVLVSRM